MTSTFPTEGSITDMEEMDLTNKLNFLRKHRKWKCMNKTEVLEEHSSTWEYNGLKCLQYQEVSREVLGEYAVKITVDIMLNEHWTDLVCGVEDTQLEETVEQLKERYNKMKSR